MEKTRFLRNSFSMPDVAGRDGRPNLRKLNFYQDFKKTRFPIFIVVDEKSNILAIF